jgi:hypothetical protein
MKGQRHIAIPAVKCMFAGRTENEVAVAAPVQKQNRLFFPGDDFRQTLSQWLANQSKAILS